MTDRDWENAVQGLSRYKEANENRIKKPAKQKLISHANNIFISFNNTENTFAVVEEGKMANVKKVQTFDLHPIFRSVQISAYGTRAKFLAFFFIFFF